MAKKRTSLDALISATDTGGSRRSATASPIEKSEKKRRGTKEQAEKTEIVKQSVYLPEPVHEQLRQLAFGEKKKMHYYLMKGLDLVFKDRGLKSIKELTEKS